MSDACPGCGRAVIPNGPATGFLAGCGRRVASADKCRSDGCVPAAQQTKLVEALEAIRAELSRAPRIVWRPSEKRIGQIVDGALASIAGSL